MPLSQISAVLMVRDAEATLAATLDGLKRFGEVVIFDNGSKDRTLEVAARYANVRIHNGEFTGFGTTRNRAASLAQHDWVFSIDADEMPDETLLAAMDALPLADATVAYSVERQNYLLGKRVKHAGWGSQWLTRLYHRRQHAFTEVAVHEKVELKRGEAAQVLPGTLKHMPMQDAGDFLVKMHRYTMLKAGESRRTYNPALILLKTLWAFIRSYILRLGFLDGWRGVLISVSEANGVFYKYMVIYSKRDGA